MWHKLLSLAVLVFTLSGCAIFSNETVEGLLEEKVFQRENLPIRVLFVAIIVDADGSDDRVHAVIEESSALLVRQVGIRLEVVVYREKLHARTIKESHRFLRKFRTEHPDFDIIAAVSRNGSDDPDECPNKRFCRIASISEERNIAMLDLYAAIFIHEIGHGFGAFHSQSGVMMEYPTTPYFSPADREIVLRHKWKVFRDDIFPGQFEPENSNHDGR